MTVQKQDIDISWELSITMGVHQLQHSWGWGMKSQTTQKIGAYVIQFDEHAYFSIGCNRVGKKHQSPGDSSRDRFISWLVVTYSFSHNHGSGKRLYLKGIYYWGPFSLP